MNDLVQVSHHDGVLVAAVNNPPVNALSPGVPEALVEAVRQAGEDDSVHAVVIIGSGRTFIAGADIREFPKIISGEAPPINLAAMLDEIERSRKPVIMAIHGTALGGGLETAMAGHYRVAARDAQVGQPEVKLGLIPGAGGTQRLPRLAGIETAMRMCAFGDPMSATDALRHGIVDRIVEGDLLEGALALAGEHPPVRRTSSLSEKLMDPAQAESLGEVFKDECRKRLRGQTAPLAAIDAVAAAARFSFADGLENERKLFEQVLHGPQCRALIHLFFGERTVAKIPFLPKEVRPLPVRRAAVAGAGTMGSGIAMCFANAGLPVLLKDSSQAALDRGMGLIRRNYENSVRKGKLDPRKVEERLALISPSLTYDGFEAADIVVEAVFEELALKQNIFREIDQVARPGAILATNTSTLDIDRIAEATARPEWVVGTHFFSPANVMRLLEVVRGRHSSPEAVATAMELAKPLKKVAVLAGNCFGFIGNRMFFPYREQAVSLVEEGAAPEVVDKTLTDWGMAMGPLAVGDLSGLDVASFIRQEAVRLQLPCIQHRSFEDVLFEHGRYGQKTGLGWYHYDENRRPSPDPEVERMVREYASVQCVPQRSFSSRQILERVLYALINEGARLLQEGIALRSVDIDVVYANGYGFPSWRGGPMHWAGGVGLATVLDTMNGFYDELGPFWKPAPLLEDLARQGKTFEQWSR